MARDRALLLSLIVLATLAGGCAKHFDVVVANVSSRDIVVSLERDTPVRARSYAYVRKGARDLEETGLRIVVSSTSGQTLATLEMPKETVQKDLYLDDLYVLVVRSEDLNRVPAPEPGSVQGAALKTPSTSLGQGN